MDFLNDFTSGLNDLKKSGRLSLFYLLTWLGVLFKHVKVLQKHLQCNIPIVMYQKSANYWNAAKDFNEVFTLEVGILESIVKALHCKYRAISNELDDACFPSTHSFPGHNL